MLSFMKMPKVITAHVIETGSMTEEEQGENEGVS